MEKKVSLFLISKGFKRGNTDTILFTKGEKGNMIIVQLYVVGIVFGEKNDKFGEKFSTLMKKEYDMSMIGEMNFVLSIQIKQEKKEININQIKYGKELVKKFKMESNRISQVPMSINCKI